MDAELKKSGFNINKIVNYNSTKITDINIESIDFSMYYIPYNELTGDQSNTKTSERPACHGFITLQKILIRRLSPPTNPPTSRVTH